MKATYKRYAKVGGGGITCPCCCGKGRCKVIEKRIGKRAENQALSSLIRAELDAKE